MLNFDVKRKINTLREILVGKVPDPKAQVEQITIALIYKFMDDIDQQGADFGGSREFFKGEYEKYAFTQIMLAEHSAQDRLNLYAEGIEKMTNNPDLPKLFRDILRNAYIPYRDPETLNRFLKEIAEFSYEDSEELGNAFEYLPWRRGSRRVPIPTRKGTKRRQRVSIWLEYNWRRPEKSRPAAPLFL